MPPQTTAIDFSRPEKTPPSVLLSLFESPRPSAGFPSPAIGYEEKTIDLNELLIRHKESTFLCRAEGDSMSPRINDGDLLIVDRREDILSGDIIVFPVNTEFFVKQFFRHPDGSIELLSLNPDFPPLSYPEDDPFVPFGKVIGILQQLP
jgi:DNA polymerase V